MNKTLADLTAELVREYDHWDQLYKNGGSDPFWSDGMNLNLVRNHITYTKNQIQELVEGERSEMSLFADSYPDIWYKETPPMVPYDFMARADDIRAHAQEQLKLYLSDPNFLYLRDHASEAYPHGINRETKEAGLPEYGVLSLARFEKMVAEDDLVEMRRSFRQPYEELSKQWKEYADIIRSYLKGECLTSNKNIKPEANAKAAPEEKEIQTDKKTTVSFENLLQDAKRRSAEHKDQTAPKEREEQISFF